MQLKQLQFHCGNPPPAAEPKTRICITTQKRKGRDKNPGLYLKQLTVSNIHRDFKAETQIDR